MSDVTQATDGGGVSRAVRAAWDAVALDRAISEDRFATYLAAARGDRSLARATYIWDRDLSSAILSDVAILEVALRNAMHDSLKAVWGARWYESSGLELDERSLGQLRRAWEELPTALRKDRSDERLPGRLVARCMFGFWVNLLDAGDHIGSAPRRRRVDYEDLWRRALHRAFPGGAQEARREGARFSRAWTHEAARVVNVLRNRAAHHEPLIHGFPLPGRHERRSCRDGYEACRKLARLIDRDLALWLDHASEVPALLAAHPRARASATGSDGEPQM